MTGLSLFYILELPQNSIYGTIGNVFLSITIFSFFCPPLPVIEFGIPSLNDLSFLPYPLSPSSHSSLPSGTTRGRLVATSTTANHERLSDWKQARTHQNESDLKLTYYETYQHMLQKLDNTFINEPSRDKLRSMVWWKAGQASLRIHR